jgi:hypothetical protein
MRLVLLLFLSAGVAFALITVPPMPGDFRVAYKWTEGPGFVAVVGIDHVPRNVTLFTEEGFDSWMKDKPGTAVYNGVLRRGDVYHVVVSRNLQSWKRLDRQAGKKMT